MLLKLTDISVNENTFWIGNHMLTSSYLPSMTLVLAYEDPSLVLAYHDPALPRVYAASQMQFRVGHNGVYYLSTQEDLDAGNPAFDDYTLYTLGGKFLPLALRSLFDRLIEI